MNVQIVHLCTVWTKSFSLQGISLQKTFREYYYSCLSNRILKNVLFWPKLNVWGSIVTKPNWNKTFPTAAVINSYAKVILHKCRFVVELYKCSIGQKCRLDFNRMIHSLSYHVCRCCNGSAMVPYFATNLGDFSCIFINFYFPTLMFLA